MLKIKNLNKLFKKNRVFKDIFFELEEGQIGVLFGKFGVGKIIILRCINGFEEFDSGEIIIDNEVIKNKRDMVKI